MVPAYQGSKVPRRQDSKVPKYQGSNVSRLQGKIPRDQVSKVQGSKSPTYMVLRFQRVKVPRYQGKWPPRSQGPNLKGAWAKGKWPKGPKGLLWTLCSPLRLLSSWYPLLVANRGGADVQCNVLMPGLSWRDPSGARSLHSRAW